MANPSPFAVPAGPTPFGNQPSTTTPFGAPPTDRSSSKSPFAGNSPFGQPPSSKHSNPFGVPSTNPFGQPTQNGASAATFAKPSEPAAASNPFGAAAPPTFSQQRPKSSGLGAPSSNGQKPKSNGFGTPNNMPNGRPQSSGLFTPNTNGINGGSSDGPFGAPKGPLGMNGRQDKPKNSQGPHEKHPLKESRRKSPQPPPQKPKTTEYARSIFAQLKKDGIRRPRWPKNPGSTAQRGAMDEMMQAYKKYRDDARKSLIKANLIDDPDKQKTLAEAIDFKGICEDMCPEYEKIKRIVQHDVKHAEKRDGDPDPSLMVKALARSAAGQEAPLPFDVLSIPSCRRTTDYLFDEVLKSDNNLSTVHGFLWDRTRAIRRDFVFHSSTTDEEKLDQIYCLEAIVRFHAVALHLMAAKGVAGDDYSEKQEIEQLSKSLLSLQEIYKKCRKEKRVQPPNEAEFVAYSILLYARDPSALSRVYQWGKDMYDTSKEVRTAIAIVESIQNTWDEQGPEIGRPSDSLAPFETALPGYPMIFSILDDPEVSYTMACFGEILFGWVRQNMLKTIHAGHWRPKADIKDFTVRKLKKMLRFDTEEEVVDFVEMHGVELGTNEKGDRYMILVPRGNIDLPKVPQTFSKTIVERKRGDRAITEAIRAPMYHQGPASPIEDSDDEPLFVSDDIKRQEIDSATPIPPMPPAPTPSPKPSPFTSMASDAVPKQNESTTAAFESSQAPSGSLFSTSSQSSGITPFQAIGESQDRSKDPFRLLNNPPSFLTQNANGESHSTFKPPAPSSFKLETTTAVPSPPMSTIAPPLDVQSHETTATPLSTYPQNSTSTRTAKIGDSFAPPHPGIQVTPPTPKQSDDDSPGPFSFKRIKHPSELGTGSSERKSFPSQRQSQSPLPQQVETATADVMPITKPKRPVPSGIFALPAQKTDPTPPSRVEESEPSPQNPLVDSFVPLGKDVAPIDSMKGFAKWIVTGDDGIMDQFLEVEVERLLEEAWDQYHNDIEDARIREEVKRDLATAKEFRETKLAIRYCSWWHQIASREASRRRGRENRAKVQAWREEKLAQDKAARLAVEKKVKRPKVDKVEEFRRVVSSQKKAADKEALETALLGTGLLKGVHNLRLTAKRVAEGTQLDQGSVNSDTEMGNTKRQKLNSTPNGLSKSLGHFRRASSSSLADGDNGSVLSGVSSILSQPHKSRGKTAKILESLRHGESLSGNFRRSLPPATSTTRSLSGSTISQQPERKSVVPGAYWRYMLHGHTMMDNGQILPEHIANEIHNGKQYPNLYAPPSSMSPPPPKRQRSVSDVAGSPETTTSTAKRHRFSASVDKDEDRKARLERVRLNDPETYELIMSTRETSTLLDDATEFLRGINRTTTDGVFSSEGP